MEIILSYPSWYILFCLLAGAVYSLVLYRKENRFREMSRWLVLMMASFRFLVVSTVTFLLLSPLIKTIFREVEKPVVIVAQDNSQSVLMVKDSSFYKNQYPDNLRNFIDRLSEKYEVRTFSFGEVVREGISFSYMEKQTDISSLFEELENRFSNRNIGALVLASDGLYNKGQNPAYASSWLKAPVYTIALGDTNEKRDVRIGKIMNNRIAFLGNSFPVNVVVDARRLNGKSTVLTIVKKGKVLFSRKIDIDRSPLSLTIPVQLNADEPGIQRYRATLRTIEGEENTINNVHDFFIDVIDGRQKILILTNAPHPDVAALRHSIESNENYEVESFSAQGFSKPLRQYNLVILHNLPSPENPVRNVIESCRASSIPVWVIGNRIPDLPLGIAFSGNLNRTNEAEPVFRKDFPLFTLSEEAIRYFSGLPAVHTPFGNYKTGNAVNILLNQRIGVVETQLPLMLFNQAGEMKLCYFAGEGLWRWKLRDFADHSDNNLFNELINKTVQYLSLRTDKSFFKVFLDKQNLFENDPVQFEAEVYNDSYELVNDPEVKIAIINSENRKFPFSFTKTSNAYRLNAGIMPLGEYRYEASVKTPAGKTYTANGSFSISPLLTEAINTVADHNVLYQLSKKTGGEMTYPAGLQKLEDMLENKEDIKPVSHSEKRLKDLIQLEWLFLVLMIFLSMEWFIRKRSGAY